ncbi:MAG: hypothetical protein V4599_02310 [Verrucomicrobiota bacterium]
MKLTPTYQAIASALNRVGRLSHSSPGRGVFVFVRDDAGFHDLLITRYPIDSMRGPIIPRLNVDKAWAGRRLPLTAAKRWGLRTGVDKMFTRLGLEITVLETQLSSLAESVPAILRHIEDGHKEGFENLLPFATKLTTTTNIWSVEANQLAHQIYLERNKS